MGEAVSAMINQGEARPTPQWHARLLSLVAVVVLTGDGPTAAHQGECPNVEEENPSDPFPHDHHNPWASDRPQEGREATPLPKAASVVLARVALTLTLYGRQMDSP